MHPNLFLVFPTIKEEVMGRKIMAISVVEESIHGFCCHSMIRSLETWAEVASFVLATIKKQEKFHV
jgi:hypothetical protein